MLNETLNEIFEQELLNRTNNIKEELKETKELLNNTKKQLNEVSIENKKLKNISDQIDMLELLRRLVNEDNFEQLLRLFNLEKTNIRIEGMDIQYVPLWFKLLISYYPNKDKLFTLMDMFDIKYSDYAKNYKMPYEYNQEEIDIFFKTLPNHYVCNGCIFDNNIGFYYREFAQFEFDIEKSLNHQYSELPWQLILRNPLLVQPNNFDKIINALKNKESHSEYFFVIQNYQNISEEQAREMFKYIPTNNLWDIHKRFVSENIFIIKENLDIAEQFLDKISDNEYSTFCYLNYPLQYQMDFIKNYRGGYYKKLDLIKKMEINKEEKLKLLNEIAESELQ